MEHPSVLCGRHQCEYVDDAGYYSICAHDGGSESIHIMWFRSNIAASFVWIAQIVASRSALLRAAANPPNVAFEMKLRHITTRPCHEDADRAYLPGVLHGPSYCAHKRRVRLLKLECTRLWNSCWFRLDCMPLIVFAACFVPRASAFGQPWRRR